MPAKRILPYVILGIISEHSQLTGKDITKEFTTDIGEFWKSSHSQIYPELRRMTADQWLKIIPDPDNDKEIHYQLTKAGRQTLNEWLETPNESLPVSKDLFSLKMFFIQDKDDPRMTALIDTQMQLVKKSLAHLNERQQLLFSSETAINQNYGHYLILQRAIARQEAQLTWLKGLIPVKLNKEENDGRRMDISIS